MVIKKINKALIFCLALISLKNISLASNQENQYNTFNLPDEVSALIFARLDNRDKLKIALTNRKFNSIIEKYFGVELSNLLFQKKVKRAQNQGNYGSFYRIQLPNSQNFQLPSIPLVTSLNRFDLSPISHTIAYLQDEKIILVNLDSIDYNLNSSLIIDLEKNKDIEIIYVGKKSNWIKFLPCGKLLAIRNENSSVIQIWNIEKKELIQTLNNLPHFTELSFSPKGKYVALTSEANGFVHIYDIKNHESKSLIDQNFSYSKTAFSPDGNYLIASKDCNIKIWNLVANTLIVTLDHKEPIHFLNFSSDGNFIISASRNNIVNIWNFESRTLHKGPITLSNDMDKTDDTLFTSNNSNLLVTNSRFHSVRVWDIEMNQEAQRLPINHLLSYTTKLQTSFDGLYLVYTDFSDNIFISKLNLMDNTQPVSSPL